MFSFRVITKWFLSYTKSTWDFDDYPIKISYEQRAFVTGKQWYANLENWGGMVTAAPSKEKVIERLKAEFESYKARNTHLPRPGTRVRIGFTSTKEVDKNRELAKDFFNKVLTRNEILHTQVTFISDSSTLPDFQEFSRMIPENYKQEIIMRTNSIYHVDITEIYDGPLYKIFELINSKYIRP